MTKLLGSLALAAMAVALAPKAAWADEGFPFQAMLAGGGPGASNTNGVAFCGGPTGLAALPLIAEGRGVAFSTLGFMSFDIQKTLATPGPLHGCITLTDINGDTLSATMDGTDTGPDALAGSNGNVAFFLASGTLTFTGGTGRFKGATGKATFTASWAPLEVVSYLVKGTISFRRD